MSQELPLDITPVNQSPTLALPAAEPSLEEPEVVKTKAGNLSWRLKDCFEVLYWMKKIMQQCIETIDERNEAYRQWQSAIVERRLIHYSEQILAIEAMVNLSPGDIKQLGRIQRRFQKVQELFGLYKKKLEEQTQSREKSDTRKSRKKVQGTFQLKVVVDNTQPPIWRALQVPGDYDLSELHNLIQGSLGWENDHLYQFQIKKKTFGENSEFSGSVLDFTLSDLGLRKGSKFIYLYDFGACWTHTITVEEITVEQSEDGVCTGGERACPLENFSDVDAYYKALKAYKNPEHPGYGDALESLGNNFDPDHFSLNRRS